jgi:hypothetical protein
MDVPDPLPLRTIPVPREVTQVDGCDCGGIEWHRMDGPYGPACSIWSVPHEQAMAAIAASNERERQFGEALNAKLREAPSALS